MRVTSAFIELELYGYDAFVSLNAMFIAANAFYMNQFDNNAELFSFISKSSYIKNTSNILLAPGIYMDKENGALFLAHNLGKIDEDIILQKFLDDIKNFQKYLNKNTYICSSFINSNRRMLKKIAENLYNALTNKKHAYRNPYDPFTFEAISEIQNSVDEKYHNDLEFKEQRRKLLKLMKRNEEI